MRIRQFSPEWNINGIDVCHCHTWRIKNFKHSFFCFFPLCLTVLVTSKAPLESTNSTWQNSSQPELEKTTHSREDICISYNWQSISVQNIYKQLLYVNKKKTKTKNQSIREKKAKDIDQTIQQKQKTNLPMNNWQNAHSYY